MPAPLLKLAAELRHSIYNHIFADYHLSAPSNLDDDKSALRLLHVCNQLRAEVKPLVLKQQRSKMVALRRAAKDRRCRSRAVQMEIDSENGQRSEASLNRCWLRLMKLECLLDERVHMKIA